MKDVRIISLFLLLIGVLMLGLPVVEINAQDDTPTPESTALERPTVLSTGLPPVSQPTRFQRTATPSNTFTPSRTPTASDTGTRTPSRTPTASVTPTHTNSPAPSLTASGTATITASVTRTYTATVTPSATPTSSPTHTESPIPTITPTPSHTATHTDTPTVTRTPTEPEESLTPTDTPTHTLTPTLTDTPTHTSTASYTPSDTPTDTLTPTITNTPEPINIISQPPTDTEIPGDSSIDPLILMGIAALFIVGIYMALYALNSAAADRYATGFLLRRCPVCEQGILEIEERPYRVLGIPRARRTVRCDNCNSILREVGRRRWRYSVDPHENRALFEDYNGRIVTETELRELGSSQSADDSHIRYLDEDEFPPGE